MKQLKLKSFFTALMISLSLVGVSQAAPTYYYFEDLGGVVSNEEVSYPFCEGETCSYENTNNIDVEFTNSSASYDIANTDIQETFNLDEGTGSATLSISVSGDDILDGTVEVSKVDGTVTISGFTAAGAAAITLTAKENGTVVDQDTLDIAVTEGPDYTDAFITTWEVSAGETVTMPTNDRYYDYDDGWTPATYSGNINWGDDSGDLEFTSYDDSDFTHTFSNAGIYTVKINGVFETLGYVSKSSIPMKTVEQLGKVGWKSLQKAFYESNITSFNSGNVDMSTQKDISWMFYNTNNLTSLNGLSDWDTGSVKTTNMMFYSANGLTSLNLSGWDVSNVENMYGMFGSSSNLTSVGDLSNWDTSSVTSMKVMFSGASSLTSVDLSDWNVSSVIDMSYMFSSSGLITIGNLSGWDTSSVTNMSAMFMDASNLISSDVSGWDTSSVTNMNSMFYNASNLSTVGSLSSWDTSSVTNMNSIFRNTSSLTSVGNISGWNISNVLDIRNAFSNTAISPIPSWY